MNDEKIETVKINTNNIEKNLDNEHLNTSQQLQNNITTDNNLEIMDFCRNLDESLSRCVQKIGIVRYSAFKDTGSDLSFAVALLDEENSGVVFNGIYSREMSNIYAKPVEKGNSSYTLSDEEAEAINKAINSNNIYRGK